MKNQMIMILYGGSFESKGGLLHCSFGIHGLMAEGTAITWHQTYNKNEGKGTGHNCNTKTTGTLNF